MSIKLKLIAVASFILVLAITGWGIYTFGGRTVSRYAGKDYRQTLEVDDMKKFISISFDKRGGSTVKDVTFISNDGYFYTVEFKDISPLEGAIRWVKYGEGASVIQSRLLSRWGIGAVNLELPDDFVTLLVLVWTSATHRLMNVKKSHVYEY